MKAQKIALFASGNGSNAINLITFFKDNPQIQVAFVLCNKMNAPVVELAKQKGVEVVICSNNQVEEKAYLKTICHKKQIDFIILAGFLRKIPLDLIQAFENKIINIHPALLPNYGGEGMYGKHVHLAVLKNKEKQHGITIHLVNAEYDKGEIIQQFSIELDEHDDLESVQGKIQKLEQAYFPGVIEQFILKEKLV